MNVLKKFRFFSVMLLSVFSLTVLAEANYPLEVTVKSIQMVANPFTSSDSVYLYSSASIGSSDDVLLITLEESVECATRGATSNNGYVTDKVILLPAPESDLDRLTNQNLYAVNLIAQAMQSRSPITIAHLEKANEVLPGEATNLNSGNSIYQNAYENLCVLNPQHFSVSAPLEAMLESASSSGGGSVEDPIETNWGFNIPTTGNYQLYAHWVLARNAVNSYTYDVNSSGTPVAENIKRSISSGIWVEVGDVANFTAGQQTLQMTIDQNSAYIVNGIKAERVQ